MFTKLLDSVDRLGPQVQQHKEIGDGHQPVESIAQREDRSLGQKNAPQRGPGKQQAVKPLPPAAGQKAPGTASVALPGKHGGQCEQQGAQADPHLARHPQHGGEGCNAPGGPLGRGGIQTGGEQAQCRQRAHQDRINQNLYNSPVPLPHGVLLLCTAVGENGAAQPGFVGKNAAGHPRFQRQEKSAGAPQADGPPIECAGENGTNGLGNPLPAVP